MRKVKVGVCAVVEHVTFEFHSLQEFPPKVVISRKKQRTKIVISKEFRRALLMNFYSDLPLVPPSSMVNICVNLVWLANFLKGLKLLT